MLGAHPVKDVRPEMPQVAGSESAHLATGPPGRGPGPSPPPASIRPTFSEASSGQGSGGPSGSANRTRMPSQDTSSTLPREPGVSQDPGGPWALGGPGRGGSLAEAAPPGEACPALPSRDPQPQAPGAGDAPHPSRRVSRTTTAAAPRAHPRPGRPPVPRVDPAGPAGVVVDVEDLAVVVPGLLPAPG